MICWVLNEKEGKWGGGGVRMGNAHEQVANMGRKTHHSVCDSLTTQFSSDNGPKCGDRDFQ